MVLLKDGSYIDDPRLDRIYEEDWRSLNHLITAVLPADTRTPVSQTWELWFYFDQGQEGACVGFGFGHELVASPVAVAGVDNAYCREHIYWGTQRIDPWPGGAYPSADPWYEGTSVLSGAKYLTDEGFYTSYDWAITTRDAALGVGYAGPAVLGLNWYEGMYEPDANGFIHPSGVQVGGHCILAIGVVIVWKAGAVQYPWENVDLDKSYFILHNSWGQSWGQNGRCKLSLRDFDVLLQQHGEAVFPNRNTERLSINEVDMPTFSDIEGHTHEEAIEWAAGSGLVNGFADGTFRPNEPVTRGQLCTILKRFENLIVTSI
jgi:hypothetical protein